MDGKKRDSAAFHSAPFELDGLLRRLSLEAKEHRANTVDELIYENYILERKLVVLKEAWERCCDLIYLVKHIACSLTLLCNQITEERAQLRYKWFAKCAAL